MTISSVRTRFAPSPTGNLHIGNARTAIMNWLFSRRHKGIFVLRIEDTDTDRSTKESETAILEDLKWLGIDWDEGPDTGGAYGPYRQSQRLENYQKTANQLLENGRAYFCFCTAEELEARREKMREAGQNILYDKKCLNLSDAHKQKFEKEGRKPVIRFRADDESVRFKDLIRGEVTFPGETIGDFVIIRQNGMPMYNFCCVVDDHDMAITHVIRGDDHVSNTPRQVLVYKAMNWDVPVFAHTPMILGPDRQRLSKRHGVTSVSQYREQGFLPEALFNFLSLLSWSSATGEEILEIEQLISEFDFSRVSKSAAVFDTGKLRWMNGQYIRSLTPEQFGEAVYPFLKNSGLPVNQTHLPVIASLFQEKIETLPEIGEKASVLFHEKVSPETSEAESIIREESAKKVFQAFLEITENLDSWMPEEFKDSMKAVQQQSGVKGKGLWMPVRIALTGQQHGPDLAAAASFIGLEKCRKLIQDALNM